MRGEIICADRQSVLCTWSSSRWVYRNCCSSLCTFTNLMGGCSALTRMDELRAAVLFIRRESWTFERTAGRIGSSTRGTSAADTEDACTLGNGALSSDWPSERYPVKEHEEVIRPRYYYAKWIAIFADSGSSYRTRSIHDDIDAIPVHRKGYVSNLFFFAFTAANMAKLLDYRLSSKFKSRIILRNVISSNAFLSASNSADFSPGKHIWNVVRIDVAEWGLCQSIF